MRPLRSLLVCLGALALGAVVWGAGVQGPASSAAAFSAPRPETPTLHAVPAASADLDPSGRRPAVGDVRLSGDAEGDDPTGGAPSLLVSARRSAPASRQPPSTGRTVVRAAPTCAALCVFLC